MCYMQEEDPVLLLCCASRCLTFALVSAAAVTVQVNGMQLAEKVVYVGPFLKRQDRSTGDNKYTNV